MRFFLAFLFVVCSFPAFAQPSASLVRGIETRLGGDNERTRLIVDLTGTVEPHTFTLADPYRVVVDLPGVIFGESPVELESRGLIIAYRYGVIAPQRSRIVIDAVGPVKVEDVRMVDAADGQPARLVIELVSSTRAAFLEAMKQGSASSLPAVDVEKVQKNPRDTRPIIVVDPGHGGIDTGAKGAGGEEEKNVVLAFAKRLAAKLSQSGRYRVVMTREDDSFVALADRVRIARENEAQLLLSIHADSLSDPFGVRGATVYTLSERASDAVAARLAEKENRSDVIAGVDLSVEPDDVANILIDLTRRETQVFSSRFAHTLVNSTGKTLRLNKNPLRSAGFIVLKAPDVPSVLMELGYMSSREDLKLLLSDSWRDKVSEAMVGAIDRYFGLSEKPERTR